MNFLVKNAMNETIKPKRCVEYVDNSDSVRYATSGNSVIGITLEYILPDNWGFVSTEGSVEIQGV